jgi:hypothetical protein
MQKQDLADFIAFIRSKEAQEMEDVYYDTHAWARYKRDWKDITTTIKRFYIKETAQVKAIGSGG